MERDIRRTALYLEVENLLKQVRQPGTGRISDAAELHASPDGRSAVFCATMLEKLEGSPQTRIARIDLSSGEIRVLTFGPNTDRLPKYSPDGALIAFLSDRHQAGDFQLYLLDPITGAARSAARVDGWVEYFHWSPDGKRILLAVAGHGADVSGGQGAITSKQLPQELPSWMPQIDTGNENYRWRRAWIHALATNRATPVSPPNCNVWEVVWCGNQALAAITSPGAGEGLWYGAHLTYIDLASGNARELYKPKDQLGWPAASPSGNHLAFVEAVCSDRWIVAGDLRVLEVTTGANNRVDTHGVDITYTEWIAEHLILVAGHRTAQTVVALFNTSSGTFEELWQSQDLSTGGRYATVTSMGNRGDCALIAESFVQAPEIAVICNRHYRAVKSLDVGYSEHLAELDTVDLVHWQAPDGLELHGWLLRPKRKPPYPLVMNIHGGPVWAWRPTWLGRTRGAHMASLVLVKRGYAVFFPNPRGSSGAGQEFARKVKGDLNGADTYDFLTGIDNLVARGIADSGRLGVTGVSYGGNMTSWLITQDARFAAAVPVAAHNNQVTEHLISNIPHFMALFLDDHYSNPGGRYFQRSPVMHAAKVKTPTLNICGALDRCTPPEESVQFHNALLENGVESALVTYPEEGHGVQKLPAAIDYIARLVNWFEQHMPA